MWINPQSVDQSTICGYKQIVWIITGTVDTFKSVIAIPHVWINSHSVDKSTAFHTQLRNPHFLMRYFGPGGFAYDTRGGVATDLE